MQTEAGPETQKYKCVISHFHHACDQIMLRIDMDIIFAPPPLLSFIIYYNLFEVPLPPPYSDYVIFERPLSPHVRPGRSRRAKILNQF